MNEVINIIEDKSLTLIKLSFTPFDHQTHHFMNIKNKNYCNKQPTKSSTEVYMQMHKQ